jgi:tetratricopeptide (TPR) repeat protein
MRKIAVLDSTFFGAHQLMGEAYEQLGHFPEAIAELQKALDVGNPWVLAALARVHVRWGKMEEARRLLAQLEERSKRDYVTPYGVATVYAALGDKNQAFRLLDKAYDDRCEDLLLLLVDPRVDSLRSDPRFRELLRRVGFPQV